MKHARCVSVEMYVDVSCRYGGGTPARLRGDTVKHQLSGRQSQMVWHVAKCNNGFVVRLPGYVTAKIQVAQWSINCQGDTVR